MKAVMLSIRPKYAEKILNGEKTYEIRKTRLPLNTPIYVYCTMQGIYELFKQLGHRYLEEEWHNKKGKVVAKIEFDKIKDIKFDWVLFTASGKRQYEFTDDILLNSCLSYDEANEYALKNTKKSVYLHHISKVEIIEPKEIGEFYKPYNPKNKSDNFCSFEEYKERLKNGNLEVSAKLTKAPQSYCYVEVEE